MMMSRLRAASPAKTGRPSDRGGMTYRESHLHLTQAMVRVRHEEMLGRTGGGAYHVSTEANKATLRRWLGALNTRNMSTIDAAADEIFATVSVIHNSTNPELAGSPEDVKQAMCALLKNMPDVHIAVEDMIAEGDKVACRKVVHGAPASEGKPVSFFKLAMYRFAGGKIAEVWDLSAAANVRY